MRFDDAMYNRDISSRSVLCQLSDMQGPPRDATKLQETL